MVFRRATLLVALLFLTAAAAFGGDAIMGKYDAQQTGYTAEKLDPPLRLLWEHTATRYRNNAASPVVVGDTCYFACDNRIYAVEMGTGAMKWKYPTDQGLGGSIKCTPVAIDGNVYFGSGDNNLYCLNAETGVFEWLYQTRGAIRCAPVVVDGIIYFGCDDNNLYAVDAATGEPAWPKPVQLPDDVAGAIAVGNGMVVASCMDGIMYGVSTTGKAKWKFRLTQVPTNTSPVITENVVVMAVGNSMYGVSLRSGQIRWTVSLASEAAAAPAVDGSEIFVPCKNKSIYAYTMSGRQVPLKWTEPAKLDAIPMSSPIIADKILYATGSRGVVVAFSTIDGTLKWRYSIAPSQVTMPGMQFVDIAASPTVANGALLVSSDDGVLHCFTATAPDSEPPDVFNVKPTEGIAMSGAPPIKISAVLYDIGSGVDFSSVAISLDGNPVEVKTDPATFTVSYITEAKAAGKPVRALADGPRMITLTAKDYAGNQLTKTWFFIADHTMSPPKRTLTDTGDTGKKDKEPPKGNRARRQPPFATPPMPPPPGAAGDYGSPGTQPAPDNGDGSGGGRRSRHDYGQQEMPPPPGP